MNGVIAADSAKVPEARPGQARSHRGGHGGPEEKSWGVSGLNLRVLRVLCGTCVVILAGALGASAKLAAIAQSTTKTVADGVYTDAQAVRGAAVYENACSGCHRADLGGATGPSLREQRFARNFAGKDLKTLFTKITTTMPRNAPASLGDTVYLDILAHLLKENGFPAGAQELTAERLDGIEILPGRPKPPPPVGDFSYVDVVGCFTEGPRQTWLLTRASEPVATTPARPAPATDARPLGDGTIQLLDARAYAPEGHRGHKMHVRGLLIRLADEQRMTISSLETVAATCDE
jgi:mono/diheme cytochrome c family protein